MVATKQLSCSAWLENRTLDDPTFLMTVPEVDDSLLNWLDGDGEEPQEISAECAAGDETWEYAEEGVEEMIADLLELQPHREEMEKVLAGCESTSGTGELVQLNTFPMGCGGAAERESIRIGRGGQDVAMIVPDDMPSDDAANVRDGNNSKIRKRG